MGKIIVLAAIAVALFILAGCVQQPQGPEPQGPLQPPEQEAAGPEPEPEQPEPSPPSESDTQALENAKQALDADLCEAISDSAMKDQCFFYIAVETGDESACSRIQEESKKAYCISAASNG
jgi:PBP1b-binding outer membrane lipoprotein LpoB